MRKTGLIVYIFFFAILIVQTGCEKPRVGPNRIETSPKTVSDCNEAFAYISYSPVKIDIVPLTEYTTATGSGEGPKIEVYVSLLDSYGSQIKSPGTFRFELYERVPRSAEPKGKRIILWPDFDLTDVAENDNHWRDFLRAYEFSLHFDSEGNQSHILQVTCLCPNGKRLLTEFTLTHTK